MAPCYDKKLEALREGLSTTLNGARGTDCVLTSGERKTAALTGSVAKLPDGTDSQGFLGSQWSKVKKILQSRSPDESSLGEPYRQTAWLLDDVLLHRSLSTFLSCRRQKVLVHTDKHREARKVNQVKDMFNLSSSWDAGNECSS